MDATIKLLQTVRLAMLASLVLYLFIAEKLARKTAELPSFGFYFAITLVALTVAGMVFAVRRLFVLRSEPTLALQPEDRAALNRWRSGYIITFALSEAIALFGFVLRVVGFSLAQTAPFYLAGFVLMLFFRPRRPSNQIG